MKEKVYTIDSWYDGARFGIANYKSTPHFYSSIYMDTIKNSNEDRFELSQTSEIVKEKAIELQQIFDRWNVFRESNPEYTYSADEFGALPDEQNRYQELKKYVVNEFEKAKQESLIVKRGKFEYGENTLVIWND